MENFNFCAISKIIVLQITATRKNAPSFFQTLRLKIYFITATVAVD